MTFEAAHADIAHKLNATTAPTTHPRARTVTSSGADRVRAAIVNWLDRGRQPAVASRVPPVDDHLELLQGLSAREIKRIRKFFTVIEAPAGKTLVDEGHVGREFILVLEGRVAISIAGIPEVVLGDGVHFGELPLLDPKVMRVRVASAHTLEPTWVAVANRREFAALMDAHPVVSRRILLLALQRQAFLVEARAGAIPADQVCQDYPQHISASSVPAFA